jgi:hypothetical protein
MLIQVVRRDANNSIGVKEEDILLNRILFGLLIIVLSGQTSFANEGFSPESSVYSIYQGLNFGAPGELTQKDFYVNIGSNQGVTLGSRLKVFRHAPTFDLVAQQVFREVTFPIAIVKVIHVESGVAIARLESFLPSSEAAAISPRAIMVGDLVKLTYSAPLKQELPKSEEAAGEEEEQ